MGRCGRRIKVELSVPKSPRQFLERRTDIAVAGLEAAILLETHGFALAEEDGHVETDGEYDKDGAVLDGGEDVAEGEAEGVEEEVVEEAVEGRPVQDEGGVPSQRCSVLKRHQLQPNQQR